MSAKLTDAGVDRGFCAGDAHDPGSCGVCGFAVDGVGRKLPRDKVTWAAGIGAATTGADAHGGDFIRFAPPCGVDFLFVDEKPDFLLSSAIISKRLGAVAGGFFVPDTLVVFSFSSAIMSESLGAAERFEATGLAIASAIGTGGGGRLNFG